MEHDLKEIPRHPILTIRRMQNPVHVLGLSTFGRFQQGRQIENREGV